MKLIFVDSLPEGGGTCARYDRRRCATAGWTDADLRSILRRRQEEWLVGLDDWHAELGRRANATTPAWWLFPGSRLTPWYPVDLKPLFMALAAVEFAGDSAQGAVHLVGWPREAYEYAAEFCAAPGSARTVLGRAAPAADEPGFLRALLRAARTTAGLAARILRGNAVAAHRARIVAFS